MFSPGLISNVLQQVRTIFVMASLNVKMEIFILLVFLIAIFRAVTCMDVGVLCYISHMVQRGVSSPPSPPKAVFSSSVMCSFPYCNFKGTVMQIEKTLINDRFTFFKSIQKIFYFNYLYFGIALPLEFAIFLESSQLFNSFYCLFCV